MKTTLISYWDLAGLHTELAHGPRIEALVSSISHLSVEEIVAFHRFCQDHQEKAQTERFFLAAPFLYNSNGVCTNEHFIELTAWLVFQGREIYTKTLTNPDVLGHLICDFTAPKDFLYVCSQAYTRKTGLTDFGKICSQASLPSAKTTGVMQRDAYAEPERIRLLLPCLHTKYLVMNRLPLEEKRPKKTTQPIRRFWPIAALALAVYSLHSVFHSVHLAAPLGQ